MHIDIPKSDLKRVVIAGGGFGGINLAKGLKDSQYQVVLLDKHNYHSFQPLLYQVATSALDPSAISFPIRKIFQKQKNFFFRMAEISNINTETKTIETTIGELEYDYLVLATGSQTNYFGMEGLIISSMPMKSVAEAIDLRGLILQNFEKALGIRNLRKKESLMTFIIAGAGPTGVELAGSIAELKRYILPHDYPEHDFKMMRILLIQAGSRVLPSFSEKSSAKALKYLEELGVEVILNKRVKDYFGDYISTDKEDYTARTLIWTTGVKGCPVNGLHESLVDKMSKRMIVDEYNRIKGFNDVFAIGDCAQMVTEKTPRGHPQVAPAAIQQGTLLAKNLILLSNNKSMKAFAYRDKGAMATIGKDRAVVEVKGFKAYGFIAWAMWMFVHLMSLVGSRNKIVVLFDWVKGYFSHDKGLRIIFEQFDLMEEKKRRKRKMLNEPEILEQK